MGNLIVQTKANDLQSGVAFSRERRGQWGLRNRLREIGPEEVKLCAEGVCTLCML